MQTWRQFKQFRVWLNPNYLTIVGKSLFNRKLTSYWELKNMLRTHKGNYYLSFILIKQCVLCDRIFNWDFPKKGQKRVILSKSYKVTRNSINLFLITFLYAVETVKIWPEKLIYSSILCTCLNSDILMFSVDSRKYLFI